MDWKAGALGKGFQHLRQNSALKRNGCQCAESAHASVGYYVRRQLSMKLNVPDPAVAVVEDMLAIGGAVVIVSRCASMKSFVTRGLF